MISRIQSLSGRINEKGLLIDRQKKMLSELMRAYYTNYASGTIMPVFLTQSESFLYFKQEDWTSEASDKMREILDSVQTLRDSLVEEQSALEAKKQEIDTLYVRLTERNDSLESTKENKAQLLAKTQAEAKKYDTLVDTQRQRDD
jgi:peptidoglycan hydrolase CwlO-like protein